MNMSEILKADLVDDIGLNQFKTEEEKLKERKNINNIIRGYISGFFDAEGMIRLEKDGTPTISIKQTFASVLYDINRIFNGTVDKHRIIKTFEQKKKAEYYRLKLMELKKDIGDDTDNGKYSIIQEQLDKNQTSIDNAWE